MRAWVIAPDGLVENTVMLPEGSTMGLPQGYALTFTEPPAPPAPPLPVPSSVRLLRFLAGLGAYGFATPEELLAAAKFGDLPFQIEELVNQLPAELAFKARLDFAGMVDVDRDNPLIVMFAASKGLDEAATDEFFRVCDSL
ncbi:hypothetical protein EAH89_17365 [Roseomonas nepalensis]|uniref:Uncharacterized protein n=1 Tax=Muricoccus nepalensis TaxID=1854500 RepID=A0A502FW62_9PROT|nr:hypothetical protein EAH89_17365 [Roseomonas nepalensis]